MALVVALLPPFILFMRRPKAAAAPAAKAPAAKAAPKK